MQKSLFESQEEVSFTEVLEQPVMWGYYRDLHQSNEYKAIVDADSGKLFSVVSKDYRLIRHEEAIERIEDAIEGEPALDEYEITTEFYNNGGRMRRTYRFPAISVEIGQNDPVNLELHLFNSYDVTWPFIVMIGAFRFVCGNGLVVGRKFLQVRKRHVFNLEQFNLEGEISTAFTRFALQANEWKRWANHQLTEATYTKIMDTMKFGKKATEEIEYKVDLETDEFDDSGFPILTIWAFFNVLTWYATHRAISLNHKVEIERRLRVAMVHLKAIIKG